MAKRPTFFLSSTIYDFRDLRSAIKFSLEERGCRVLASEFNDFGGDLDQHSYEACLTNIEQADYFVLLVGARVGGWYDSQSKISITQREYRAAYKLHQERKLRLVTFVRSEVWQLKEDRRELARVLREMSLTDSERKAVVQAPSKFANDAAFVSDFIAEVGRNLETGIAVAKGTEKPTGNWIYQFRDFRDISDVLSPLAFTGLSSEEAAYRKALQHELLIVMAALLGKSEGTVLDFRGQLKRGIEAHPVTKQLRDRGQITVDLKAWGDFTTVFFDILGVALEPVVIKDALTSTIFLDFDREKGGYVQSQAYDALSRLWDELRRFRDLNKTEMFAFIIATSPNSLGRKTGPHDLPTEKVCLLYALAQRWINIVSLTEALIIHLEGRPFSMPQLMPISPVAESEHLFQAELVSVDELRAALGIIR